MTKVTFKDKFGNCSVVAEEDEMDLPTLVELLGRLILAAGYAFPKGECLTISSRE